MKIIQHRSNPPVFFSLPPRVGAVATHRVGPVHGTVELELAGALKSERKYASNDVRYDLERTQASKLASSPCQYYV